MGGRKDVIIMRQKPENRGEKMAGNIVPPFYLLQTNFGIKLASLLSKEMRDLDEPNDSLMSRLLAEGLMGDCPQLLLENEYYYENVLSILGDRVPKHGPQSQFIKDNVKESDDELHVDDNGEALENSGESDIDGENTDDRLLDEHNAGYGEGSASFAGSQDHIASILARNVGLKYHGYPLPTGWIPGNASQSKLLVKSCTSVEELKKKEEFFTVSESGLVVNAVSSNKYGSGALRKQPATVFLLKSNNCVPAEAGVFYFEIKINTNIKKYNLSLGYARSGAVYLGTKDPEDVNSRITISAMPGVAEFSYGYNGQKAAAVATNKQEKPYGYTFGRNDTVGCGINFHDNVIFYTKNGQYLGTAFDHVECDYVVPVIGFDSVYDETHEPSTANSVQSLTNNAYALSHRLSRHHRPINTNFRSFADSFDQFNNNHVLHEITTNFGYTVADGLDGAFYFDINGYINGLKAKLFTKINKSNLELAKAGESSFVAKKLDAKQKNLSISSLLNTDKNEIDPTLVKQAGLISSSVNRLNSNNKLVLKDVECKAVINSLINNYFDHLGYVESKNAFLNDLALENPPNESVSPHNLIIKESVDNASSHKQHIRNYILNDDTKGLFRFLQLHYNLFFNITESDYTSDYSSPENPTLPREKYAEDLVFEIKCLKLIKLIRNCVKNEKSSLKYIDEAIEYSKLLIKQYNASSARVQLLNNLFKLLITSGSSRKPKPSVNDLAVEDELQTEDVPKELMNKLDRMPTDEDDDDDDQMDVDFILDQQDNMPSKQDKNTFHYLLKAKNFKSLKLKVVDKLNSYILLKLGKSSISNLEKLVNLTGLYLKIMSNEKLSDDVLFLNLHKDILK